MNEVEKISKKSNQLFFADRDSEGIQLLPEIYRAIRTDPSILRHISDWSSLGLSFYFMITESISDDIDTQQMIASLSYLFISKAIEADQQNLDLYKSRLLLLKYGHDPLKYTVMSALELDSGGFMAFSLGNTDFKARDAIYKMEISDLELHPQLYQQTPFFKERKERFDSMIARSFFMPEKTLENVIKAGIDNHDRLLKYLINKVLDEGNVDF